MQRSLVSRGNGWAIPTDKNIIKLLSLDPMTSEVQFKIKNKILYIQEITPDNPEYKKSLVRKFSKKNSSWSFYLPNSIIDLLEINPETDKIDIEVDENILIVKKAQ